MENNSIICVNRKQYQDDHYWMGSLTIGKVYDVSDTSDKLSPSYIWIDGDDGLVANRKGFTIYPKIYFVSLDVWREMQINKLV